MLSKLLKSVIKPHDFTSLPDFHNAYVQFLPMDTILHLFVVVSSRQDFDHFPGAHEATATSDAMLESKVLQVMDAHGAGDTMARYPDGILLHVLYVDAADGGLLS